jgi:hypothetical protein
MTRTLLLLCLLACALPASASASTLTVTTPPDATYSGIETDIPATVSGTSDTGWSQVAVVADSTGQACAATYGAEQKQQGNWNGGNPGWAQQSAAGAFSQPIAIHVVNLQSPSDWKLCAYLYDLGTHPDTDVPSATASSGVFTLTNPKMPTGADRGGFEFVIAKPRSARPTLTLAPGDKLWLGGSFGYGVNPWACATDHQVTWFSDAFKGAGLRSHGAPAVKSEVDSMGGLQMRYALAKSLKPGKYKIQAACTDGSLATQPRVLTIAKPKKR